MMRPAEGSLGEVRADTAGQRETTRAAGRAAVVEMSSRAQFVGFVSGEAVSGPVSGWFGMH